MKLLFKNAKGSKVILENRNKSEVSLRKYAFCEINDVYKDFCTSDAGLDSKQAEEKHEEYGPNIITSDSEGNTLSRLKDAVINPFNIVLLIIAAISFVTDVLLSQKNDYLTIMIILFLVFISSLVAFIQGERSNAAAKNLSKMISNKVDVLRDGELVEILLEEVVCGDIIKLSAGDMIPADVRFLATKDAFIAQAAITGESNPIEKRAYSKNKPDDALTDLSNIGFMGSNMVSGSATAVALAIGSDTFFGSMAKTLSGDRAKNSFERGVDSVSLLLIQFMLVMVPVVFLINGFTKGDWVNSLLFAVTIAVGLTPEMLPVIMTSTLARGAINMSRHNVIVKTLGAIQTFGEMDVLCTDKTGTLTEDKIILERYMNLHGEEDTRILRHAYLNSYYQTGLKNLIDLAIINRANQNGLEELLSDYIRIDEIPFDFTRRRMSVVLSDKNGKRQLITKGAVEEVISICSYVELAGEVVLLDEKNIKEAMDNYEKYNLDGLRMIAVAHKNEVSKVYPMSRTFWVFVIPIK